jgi:ferritin-like metal-binding protein YciE
MPAQSLQQLFVEELRDTYDAEKRLIRALPKMAKAASADELQTAFRNHLRETERQVGRLEQVFRTIGEKPRGKKCDGMIGIVEESNTAIEELEDGPVLDAALIAGAQKVEHYEIASYGTLAYFAELLGNDRAKDLLGETLEEEKAADEKLSAIAKSKVNREALMGGGEDSEEDDSGMQSIERPARRMASGAAMANDRGAAGRGGSTRSSGRSSTRSQSSGSRSRAGSSSSRSRSTTKRGSR